MHGKAAHDGINTDHHTHLTSLRTTKLARPANIPEPNVRAIANL